MKNIVISANTTWYLYNFRKNTILSLLNEGYGIFIVAPKDAYTKKIQEIGCEVVDISIDSNGKNPINDFSLFISFYLIYKKIKPSLVLNFTPKNNIYSSLAAGLHGIPSINNVAGLGTVFIQNGFTCKIVRFLYRISQPYAKKIFFQNEDDLNLFLMHRIVSRSSTDVLPGSGVDLTRFRTSTSSDDGVVRFLLIARMLYDKGIVYYADSARILKEKFGNKVEFQLLGFIDDEKPGFISKKQITSWVQEGIISYLGVSDNVEEHINIVDCVVLPSFYREGVPRSLLEAAAMGKPIVTTNNVGCKETVVDGVNGFLCEPKSIDSLVCSLEKMILLSHKERLMMGMKSRELAEEKFDENIVINKYLDSIKVSF